MRVLRSLAGIFVGKIVLRAQLIPIGKLSGLKYVWTKLFSSKAEVALLNKLWPEFVAKNAKYEKENPELAIQIKRELLNTPDGAKLDTIEFVAKNKDPKEYVIYGWNRSDCYELHLARLASDALNLNKKIISFNYRGVGHSEGQVYSERCLINDFLFQANCLLEKGVSPKNIKICAHSLGGAISTFAIEELINKQKPIKYVNDRSFANLIETSVALYFKRHHSRRRIVNVGTMVLVATLLVPLFAVGIFTFVQTAILLGATFLSLHWKPTHSLFDKTVGWALEKTMRNIMIYGGWELKAGEKFDLIPPENKIHTVIRVPKNPESKTLGKRTTKQPLHEDKVILSPDSLHKNSKDYRTRKNDLKEQLQKATQEGDAAKIESLKDKLCELSNAKMSGGGHMSDPKEFITWYKSPIAKRPITGQERLYAFLEPEGDHLPLNPRKYKSF